MAEIRCPSCGKNNPDFLDACQFCQSPLRSESTLHIGESPVKKDTGELEPILPQWLRDVRKQGRESAEEDAAEEAAKPKVQKNEPPDLLAGLASQARDQEDEIPDWLASINPPTKPKTVSSPEPETDFFAQFNKSEPASVEPVNEPALEEIPSWISRADKSSTTQPAEEKDELSEWLAKASAEPSVPIEMDSDTPDWTKNLDSPSYSFNEPAPIQKEEEDLGWLRTLEDSAKQGTKPFGKQDQTASLQNQGWTPADASGASSEQEDLSWLNQLGTGEAFSPGQPEQTKPTPPQEDLSWLNQLGGTGTFVPDQPEQAKAVTPKEDLSWMNDLGGMDAGTPNQPEQVIHAAPQEDLSWLNALGGTSEPLPQESTPASPTSHADNLDWLNNLEGQGTAPFEEKPAEGELSWLKDMDAQRSEPTPSSPDSPFGPRRTGPLGGDSTEDSMPDWLKEATEEPSMPPPGAISDWFREKNAAVVTPPSTLEPSPALAPGASVDQTQGGPVSAESSLLNPSGDSKSLSSQDVDSLFSTEMPDWLSQPEPGSAEPSSQKAEIPGKDDSLAPVDLPSWVQAMRPVESVIAGTPSVDDQPTERDGPLAGLRGVIPVAPIGSSRRPKAISLKLQASDEQQAGAALLERILASETNPRPLVTPALVASQRVLRLALTGLFMVVLVVMIFLRTQTMPVSAVLPFEVSSASSAIVSLPQNSSVLVVIDYEPALSGELEAASGPLLDQLVSVTHPRLTFLSTSPNGSALVDRLLLNTKISLPAPPGLDYKAGENYFNSGFLPGGSSGVLEFVESPSSALPSVGVTSLSEYAAVILLTDHAESARSWVEQLNAQKQKDPSLANQPLLVVASAQAAPMLQPYVSSRQITGMVSGLPDAVRYEFVNNSRPGTARIYWDSFGVGLLMAVALITIGSLWSLFTGIRARRAEAELG